VCGDELTTLVPKVRQEVPHYGRSCGFVVTIALDEFQANAYHIAIIENEECNG
jgi:hypothetical protein